MVQNGGFHDKTEQMGFERITDVLFTKTNFNNTGREKNKIRKQPPGFCLVTCEVLLNSKMPSFCASAYTGYCSFYCLMAWKGWQVVADCRLKPLIEIHTKYTPTLAIISNGYTGGVFLGYPGAESEFSQIPMTFEWSIWPGHLICKASRDASISLNFRMVVPNFPMVRVRFPKNLPNTPYPCTSPKKPISTIPATMKKHFTKYISPFFFLKTNLLWE